MKRFSLVIFLMLGGLILIAWASSPVRPSAWLPDLNSGLSGVYAANDKLFERNNVSIQQRFLKGAGKGPEDMVIGDDGYLYTGYDPKSAETRVRMDDLFFANGVALGPNDEFVLINETGKAKIHRLWLKGEKAGQRDIFIQELPAMPDNLYYKDGIFWVSLVTMRDPLVEELAQNIFLRRLIGGIPKILLRASSHYGFVIGVTSQGEVIENMQSARGYQSITTAIEFEGHLFLGSLENSSIAVVKID